MNYRDATILAEETLGAATTKTIDLNVSQPISRIELSYKITLEDYAMLAALVSPITKLELVDGSDVLHSLSGVQNQALCIYDRRVPTMNHDIIASGAGSHATLGIDFGRYLWDRELAFDPSRFKNPQLKITHNRALLSAATTVHSLEIHAQCFDERAISPIGFLMAKEHWTWTPSTNNEYGYADLPTDYPIRQILLRPYLTQVRPLVVVDHFKLSEDNDKRIPLDLELTSYVKRMHGVWQKLQEGCGDTCWDTNVIKKYVTPTGEETNWLAMGIMEGATVYVPQCPAAITGGYVQMLSSTSGVNYQGIVSGYLPHHTIQFPFGLQDDIDDWYDVTKVGSLRARMQAAASCSTTSVVSLVLQQLRRY